MNKVLGQACEIIVERLAAAPLHERLTVLVNPVKTLTHEELFEAYLGELVALRAQGEGLVNYIQNDAGFETRVLAICQEPTEANAKALREFLRADFAKFSNIHRECLEDRINEHFVEYFNWRYTPSVGELLDTYRPIRFWEKEYVDIN